MKKIKYFSIILVLAVVMSACRKDVETFEKGYDHHYIAMYDYNYSDKGDPSLSNTSINVKKSEGNILPLSVKLMSQFVRDYDVDVRMYIRNTPYFLTQIGVIKPPAASNYTDPKYLAVAGIDFNVVDDDGTLLTPIREDSLIYYNLRFQNARKATKKYYLKMLNNIDIANVRSVWFSLTLHAINGNISQQEFIRTSLNHQASEYRVSSMGSSYFRRINIE